MALIKCPECGKEISDQAKSCPGCGYIIKNTKKKYKLKKKFIPILIGLLIIPLLLIVFWGLNLFKNNSLNVAKTPVDIAAKNSYEDLKSQLLDPNSLTVYDCHVGDYTSYDPTEHIDEKWKNNEEYMKLWWQDHDYVEEIMVNIHYGAKNKMGGITENNVVYACDSNGDIIEYASLSDWKNNMLNYSHLIAHYCNICLTSEAIGWNEDIINYSQKELEKL